MKEGNMKANARIHQRITSITILVLIPCIFIGAGAAGKLTKEGLVEHIGAQKNIMATGKAEGVMELKFFEGKDNIYAVGPAAGLDGEITICNSRPYVSKARGNDYDVDNTLNHDALFLVWSQIPRWKNTVIKDSIKSYVELQKLIKVRASASGIDVSKPFPFQVSGTSAEIVWHINVDRTEGSPITRDLFVKSKATYTTNNEPVDIIGFYSESHHGIFISQYAPAIQPNSGDQNAVHMHFVSRKSKAAGHIDDITHIKGMTLRLPETQ